MIIYTQALVNIALLSVLFIYVWLNLKKISNRIIFSATTITIAAILILKFNIVETFNNGNTRSVLALCNGMISGDISEEADPRLFIYYCDKELLAKQIVFGYGVGDVQDKLNACYLENNFKSKYKSDRIFNSHNYFIHLWLAGGILTMLLFIFMLFFNARLAFSNKDYAYLFFLFFVGVNLLFDNILLRFQGALYFALFNSLFLLQNLKAE
jgi:O-antigen ligase